MNTRASTQKEHKRAYATNVRIGPKIGTETNFGMQITKIKVPSDNEWWGEGVDSDVIEMFKSCWKLAQRLDSVRRLGK